MKTNYLSVISAQIQCINELAEGKKETLSITHCDSSYCIEKTTTPETDHRVVFQGKGRACHLFLNGYLASFMA
ncbi:hypothetical protein [Vibrio aerogenes]|uniref:hypothetical protein n=1 Tax=Vibrio aerogenes TaxID=92172 RepID=UPI0039EDF151